MVRIPPLALVAALLLPTAGHGAPATCRGESGDRPALVVELYTSEGCNSCPPADQWLERLPLKTRDGRAVVPLGFHVDYWDTLGWRDRFAAARFDERQSEAVRRNGGRTAYTPQVFIDGMSHPDWRAEGLPAGGVAAAAPPLTLEAAPAAGGWSLRASGHLPTGTAGRLWLGVTESDLVTPVKAGENAGTNLRHAHVVRAWSGPIPLSAGQAIDTRTTLAVPKDLVEAHSRFVALLEDPSGRPLQAVAIPGCSR